MPDIKNEKPREDISAKVIVAVSAVLILIAIVSSYLSIKEYGEKTKTLETEKKNAQTKLNDYKANVDKGLALYSRIGWLSRDERKISAGDSWNIYDNLRDFLNRMVNYLATNYQITDYKEWDAKEAPESKKTLNVQQLIDILEHRTQDNTQETKNSIDSRNTSWSEVTKVIGTSTLEAKELKPGDKGEVYTSLDEKATAIKATRDEISSLETQYNEIVDQGERDVLAAQEGIKETNTKIISETKKGDGELLRITNEKKEYEDRLEKLRHRLELASEGIEIDGEVILADIDNGYVCVDLGRKDAVIKGMDFEVFSILKGGIKKTKGRVKIIKIFDDYSQASITPGTMKVDDPINTKDLVNSDIYSRQQAKTFIFAGKPIGKYELDDLKKKIEEFGGRVLSEVTPDITYVVVGKDFENDEIYKKAIHLGAVVLREKELYDLLRLEWRD